MAIVSDLPFTLKIIKMFPKPTEFKASLFFDKEEEIWSSNLPTVSIEENEDVSILFDSDDSSARLYLEAMDIIPTDDKNVLTDENGYLYRGPSKSEFVLYKNGSGSDALCVDLFRIIVLSHGEKYYGTLQVLPKPVSLQEWNIMKDDLECEMTGLAQDIIRRNIGIGHVKSGSIPPKALYEFMVINQNADSLLAALIDISANPRFEIRTEYRDVPDSFQHELDSETVKRYVMRAGSEAFLKVPEKIVYYDIQDNRMLKMMLQYFNKRLENFIDILHTLKNNPKSDNSYGNESKKDAILAGISSFEETAAKLRKMESLLQSSGWYKGISTTRDPYIPHSLILDSRYNTVYQVYLKLRKENFDVEFDPLFSYTWKQSSFLYEMWSYFKICHLLAKKYTLMSTDWPAEITGHLLFPFLQEGTETIFQNKQIRMSVIFDYPLPQREEDTDLASPLYIVRRFNSRMHNRPDIVINIFDISTGWYIGSILLECKYRKIGSFWNTDPNRSSIGQFETYYSNARSKYLCGAFGSSLKMRPVTNVFVLTPDENGDGIQRPDYGIKVFCFKPASDDRFAKSLFKSLQIAIEEMSKKVKVILSRQ